MWIYEDTRGKVVCDIVEKFKRENLSTISNFFRQVIRTKQIVLVKDVINIQVRTM